jgi:hypothetical protein
MRAVRLFVNAVEPYDNVVRHLLFAHDAALCFAILMDMEN